jgi:hypothetical protein
MNNILGPVLALVVTVLFLFLREFILAIGKNRISYGTQEHRSGVFDLDTQLGQGLVAGQIAEFEDPIFLQRRQLQLTSFSQSYEPGHWSNLRHRRAARRRMSVGLNQIGWAMARDCCEPPFHPQISHSETAVDYRNKISNKKADARSLEMTRLMDHLDCHQCVKVARRGEGR